MVALDLFSPTSTFSFLAAHTQRPNRFVTDLLASVLVATFLIGASPAHANHTVFCRADLPVHPGESMTWRATVSGGSGSFTFSWTGSEGLAGNSEIVAKTYDTVGFRLARVTVNDPTNGDTVTSGECHGHVIPVSSAEPPNVNPVLWVPNDVDPAPLIPEVERAWRAVQAAFVDQFGKTFFMNPLTTVISPNTEFDICGGDCTEIPGGVDLLMSQAQQEAQDRVGDAIPYSRAVQVLAWGAGGFAGSFGWDRPLGGVGDWAIGGLAGVPIPPNDPDLDESAIGDMGRYFGLGVDVIAHELNHAIGMDDPHDFTLTQPPNDYEKQFALAGPWLTETLPDETDPVISFTAPDSDATVSDTTTVSVDASDETGLDAVVFLVDDHFMAVDETSPFSFEFDTKRVGFGLHQLQAIAYDDQGNSATAIRNVTILNQVTETSCSESFPLGVFHACFFDGANLEGPYLGTLLDPPFPIPSSNLGTGILHRGFGGIAFGQSDTVSAVWRGTLDFPAGNYILRFFTDDGLRVEVNGVEILDEWQDQLASFARVVSLDGPTPIKIEWFQNFGDQALVFRWQPTRQEPPTTMVVDLPESVALRTGKRIRGNAGSLAADDDSVLRVDSERTGKHARTTSWIGRFNGVPNDLRDLRVNYVGSNSRACSQVVAIRNWTTVKWIRLDSRQVGSTDVAITGLIPPGPEADFVSNTSGLGDVHIRVRCERRDGNFVARGNLLRLDYGLGIAFGTSLGATVFQEEEFDTFNE
jgi:hypothetical protein